MGTRQNPAHFYTQRDQRGRERHDQVTKGASWRRSFPSKIFKIMSPEISWPGVRSKSAARGHPRIASASMKIAFGLRRNVAVFAHRVTELAR